MSTATSTTESGHELPIGYRLEEFEIKKVLGSGGFGITYLAMDIDLKRDVVLKENLPFQCAMRDSTRSVRPRTSSPGDRDQFEWALQSFLREAETLSRFDHPNIVRVLRRFEANNTAYFVMPYVPGESLKQVIDEQVGRQEAFTEARLKELLLPLLDALEALHREGVYHRDIKAANVLLTRGHRPILIDFGAARQFISEKSHTVVESAGYTPFEQLQSRGNVGPWSDIYALAGTFFTAIHGEPPPRASDRVRRDPIIKLADHYSENYSRPFLAALDWGLAVDETDRPQSVDEWRKAFQSATVPDRKKVEREDIRDLIDPDVTRYKPREKRVEVPRRDPEPRRRDPEPVPSPFPFVLLGKIAGAALGFVLLALLVSQISHSLFVKPGSLSVTASPANATVHIPGHPDSPVPAQFDQLRPGTYEVTISAPGYDSLTKSVEIATGQAYPWSEVELQRALGTLNLTGIPAHASYHLVGSPQTGNKEYRGTMPAILTDIPSGSYEVSLSSGDLHCPPHTVQVAPHTTTNSQQDLVRMDASQNANTNVAEALLGRLQPSQLSGDDRASYEKISRQLIGAYLHQNLFAEAGAQIALLKTLGDNVQDEETALAQARNSFQKEGEDSIRSLINAGRFGAAQSRLSALSQNMEKDDADRLNSEFQGQLASYQQEESQALQAASSADPVQGYAQLNTFVTKYPDSVPAQLALADLSTHLAPDHNRLSAELAAFKGISKQDIDANDAVKLQQVQSHLQRELATYDDLLAKVNAAKGTTNYDAKIRKLESNMAYHRQQLQLPFNDGVNTAWNSAASLFGGSRRRVESPDDHRQAIQKDQDAIAQLQREQTDSTTGNSAAQTAFDNFCKTVPW